LQAWKTVGAPAGSRVKEHGERNKQEISEQQWMTPTTQMIRDGLVSGTMFFNSYGDIVKKAKEMM
jgi:hypothetical protein